MLDHSFRTQRWRRRQHFRVSPRRVKVAGAAATALFFAILSSSSSPSVVYGLELPSNSPASETQSPIAVTSSSFHTSTSSNLDGDVDADDDDDAPKSHKQLLPRCSNSSLNILVLCEPCPITYTSGLSVRFRSLLEYLARSQTETGDQTHLVTVTSSSASSSSSSTAAVHQTRKGVLSASACCNGIVPIHYTWGVRLPQYPDVTLALDVTNKVWRLCSRGPATVNEGNDTVGEEEKATTATRIKNCPKFDILHVSSPGLLVLPAMLASRWQGIPLVMSYHTHIPAYIPSYFGKWPQWAQSFMEWLSWRLIVWVHANYAHVTVVTSPQIANEFRSHGLDKECHVWPKGVNTTQFHPQHASPAMRRRMMGAMKRIDINSVTEISNSLGENDEDDNTLLLVYIGRLAKEKRVKDLKSMLERLQEGIEDATSTSSSSTKPSRVHLCIVGSGPEEAELHAYFEGTNTTFLGSLYGLPLSQAYASADVFVMPSDTETLGFVVMESMASGVPVVAAASGGILDLIDDNETGFLVPPGDTNAFAGRILELHRNPELCRLVSLAGRQAANRWSWESSMDFMRWHVYPLAMRNFRQQRRQRQHRRRQFLGFWGKKRGVGAEEASCCDGRGTLESAAQS